MVWFNINCCVQVEGRQYTGMWLMFGSVGFHSGPAKFGLPGLRIRVGRLHMERFNGLFFWKGRNLGLVVAVEWLVEFAGRGFWLLTRVTNRWRKSPSCWLVWLCLLVWCFELKTVWWPFVILIIIILVVHLYGHAFKWIWRVFSADWSRCWRLAKASFCA